MVSRVEDIKNRLISGFESWHRNINYHFYLCLFSSAPPLARSTLCVWVGGREGVILYFLSVLWVWFGRVLVTCESRLRESVKGNGVLGLGLGI